MVILPKMHFRQRLSFSLVVPQSSTHAKQFEPGYMELLSALLERPAQCLPSAELAK
jgi:hypothetical protein